jgi:hypothetical protein
MAAGETKRVNFEIAAEDKFSGAFDKLGANLVKAERDFQRFAAGVAGALGLLGTAGGLGALAKSIVDAGDEAFKMAQKVGVSVEAWQQLAYVAKLAGIEHDSLAKGLKSLSVQLFDASQGGAEAQRMFAQLGITTKDATGAIRPTEQVLLDLADRFEHMSDGAAKTALAVKLLGKAGIELVPMLNGGREGMEQLMQEAVRLGVVLDTKTAGSAEALNDNLTRLQTATRGMMVQGVAPLIPFMEKMSDSMVRARTEGDGLATGSKILETALKMVGSVAIVVKGTFEALGQLIGGIAAAWVQWVNLKPGESLKTIKQTFADVGSISTQNKQVLADLWKGTTEGAQRAAKSVGVFNDELHREGPPGALEKLLDKLLGVPETTKNLALLNTAMAMGAIDGQTYAAAIAAVLKLDPEVERTAKAQMALQESVNKALAEGIAERRREMDAIQDLIDKETEANLTRGMSRSEIEQLTVVRLEERLAILQASGAMESELQQMQEQIDKRRTLHGIIVQGEDDVRTQHRMQGELEQQARLWDDISDRAGRFFSDLATHGRSAFQRLGDELKAFAAEIIALFAKRWVLQMAAGFTGSSALGTQAQQVGQGTATNAAGSLIGSGLDYGSTALGYTAFGGVADLSAGWTAGSAFAVGAAETAPVYGTLMGEIGGALGSIPVYGWIALAVVAIGAWFSATTGAARKWAALHGPLRLKRQAFSATPRCPVRTTAGSTRRTRCDSETQKLVQGIGTSYAAALSRFGGTGNNFRFGLGSTTTRWVTRKAACLRWCRMLTGRSSTAMQDRNMDDKEVPQALLLEGQRMVLAALQASELPPAIAAILKTVNAASASQEQINAVFQLADAFQTLTETLTASRRGISSRRLRRRATDRFVDQGNALLDLAGKTTITIDSLKTLTARPYRLQVGGRAADPRASKTRSARSTRCSVRPRAAFASPASTTRASTTSTRRG